MYDFIKLLDKVDAVVEYNQENLKIVSAEGTTSLLRSFPSKVSVRSRVCLRTDLHALIHIDGNFGGVCAGLGLNRFLVAPDKSRRSL